MFDDIIKTSKILFYRIYYAKEFDLFDMTKYVPKYVEESTPKGFNIKPIYMNTLERSLNLFQDIIKDYVLRQVPNLKKIKYEITHFDPSNRIHALIQKVNELFIKVDPEELHKSIITIIYGEDGKILNIAIFGYKNIKEYDLDHYYLMKDFRKNPNKYVIKYR